MNSAFAYLSAVSTMMISNDAIADINGYLNQKQSEISVFDYTRPVIFDSLTHRVSELMCLDPNWDGYGAVVPDLATYTTVLDFIQKIDRETLSYLNNDDIVPTPYGTIVLDFSKGENLVSVEIGEDRVGFFTDFVDGDNSELDGDVWRNMIPEKLTYALKQLSLCQN